MNADEHGFLASELDVPRRAHEKLEPYKLKWIENPVISRRRSGAALAARLARSARGGEKILHFQLRNRLRCAPRARPAQP